MGQVSRGTGKTRARRRQAATIVFLSGRFQCCTFSVAPSTLRTHTATDRRVRLVRALAINFDRGPAGRPARGERRPQQIYTAERLAYGVARKFNLRSLCWVSRLADRPDV